MRKDSENEDLLGEPVEGEGDEAEPDPNEPDTRTESIRDVTAAARPAALRPQPISSAPAVTTLDPVVSIDGFSGPHLSQRSTDEVRGAATGSASPFEVLRHEEVARTKLFLLLCLVIVATALGGTALAEGNLDAKIGVVLGSGLVIGACLWLLAIIRKPQGYTIGRVAVGATAIAAGTFLGIYFWGVASPAIAIILFGIYFFSVGSSTRGTLYVYLMCAGLHAVLAALIFAGIVPDHGVVPLTTLSPRNQVMTQIMVQVLFLAAYVMARFSRRTTLDAVTRLERAVRAVAQREALLAEARQELERALKVGGPGRYSDQIVGSFRLGLLIGRGGMGEVYEGKSVHDGSEAAVKLLTPGSLADPQHVIRFLREAEAAAKLDSPHVVAVLEVGTTAGEIPFLAMERLRGNDLAHHLRKRRRLGLRAVVKLVEQVAAGLEAARQAGIVHRDIKPHNLFLAEKHKKFGWKILDFGVSKLEGQHGTLTRGHVVGTPGYMPPEQARGEEADHQADTYALAAIAYRCITGHPPFTGKDVPTILYDVVYKMPTQPGKLVEVSTDIERVLAIGLAKKVSDRWKTAEEFAQALGAAVDAELRAEIRARADSLIARHPWGRRL